METAITPSIVKNVVRMPRERVKQVRTRISYMTPEQLDRFLRAAKGHGLREQGPLRRAVQGSEVTSAKVLNLDNKSLAP